MNIFWDFGNIFGIYKRIPIPIHSIAEKNKLGSKYLCVNSVLNSAANTCVRNSASQSYLNVTATDLNEKLRIKILKNACCWLLPTIFLIFLMQFLIQISNGHIWDEGEDNEIVENTLQRLFPIVCLKISTTLTIQF